MSAARYAHVSWLKRYDNDGKFVGPGGVERFGYFLQQAIPDMQIFAASDLPSATARGITTHWELAEALNHWLLDSGQLDENSVVVGDNFWVAGLPGKVARCIATVHGSYIGTAVEHEKYGGNKEWTDPQLGVMALKQEEIWRDPNVEVVSVSNRTAFELEVMCGVSSAVIEHGIPLDIFKPLDVPRQFDLVLHGASGGRKNLGMIDKVKALTNDFEFEKVGYARDGSMEEEAALWNRGSIVFAPSYYEGNAYLLLEAMACGLVPVAYATGYACDLPCHVAEVSDCNHENNWEMLLEEVQCHYDQYFPRQWAEDNLSFDRFAKEWRAFLEVK